MNARWHIAQINVATARYPMDDPRISEFVNRLDTVNALADASPGFVWRLQDDAGNATGIDAGRGPNFIVNMSVWESVEALFDFVYRTGHRDVMIRRREWFERPAGSYQTLWWVAAGHTPTVEEGLARLDRLDREGPGPAAFTFRARYPHPGATDRPTDLEPAPWCSGW